MDGPFTDYRLQNLSIMVDWELANSEREMMLCWPGGFGDFIMNLQIYGIKLLSVSKVFISLEVFLLL